ncbi:MAG: 1-deoxy-D-xylulose-5-phosphate reductoisomerase, partial [Eubacterium sp.]|nr:1-deoxy-D-xylulose-5-phosphate reductoisomerase [Eubacterium sp.]
MERRKKIAILGSTGSIGVQTIDVVERNADLEIVGLGAAGHNLDVLEAQVRRFRPKLAAVYDEAAARDFAVRIKDTGCRV